MIVDFTLRNDVKMIIVAHLDYNVFISSGCATYIRKWKHFSKVIRRVFESNSVV